MMPLVEILNVQKRFGSHEVLKGVSLNVEAGEVVCLLGSSGSGKTTLLRCINHLETIDAGEIKVAGELIGYARGPDGRLRRKRIASLRPNAPGSAWCFSVSTSLPI